jgi:hypothetical protein
LAILPNELLDEGPTGVDDGVCKVLRGIEYLI